MEKDFALEFCERKSRLSAEPCSGICEVDQVEWNSGSTGRAMEGNFPAPLTWCSPLTHS